MATINTGTGNDMVWGTASSDKISAGSGNDVVIAGRGNDGVNAGSGNDLVLGCSGDDRISAGSGNDVVFAGAGNDKVDGGSGNDILDGGSGNDKVDGGSGNDIFIYRLGENTGEPMCTPVDPQGIVRVYLTDQQWNNAVVKQALADYHAHLETVQRNRQGEVSNGASRDFTLNFGNAKLTVQMMETLEVLREQYEGCAWQQQPHAGRGGRHQHDCRGHSLGGGGQCQDERHAG